MRAQESIQFEDIAATTETFFLNGGVYVLAASGTDGGAGAVSVSLELPDGSFVDTHTPIAPDGISPPLYLPPGNYRITVADTTALTTNVTRVPFD